MSFHGDCWGTLHATVQQGYVDRFRDEGVGSLLEPYQRAQMASWLPEAAIDAAVESLTVHLEATPVRDDADVCPPAPAQAASRRRDRGGLAGEPRCLVP